MNYAIHYVIHYLRNMETDEAFAGDDRTSAGPACHSNTSNSICYIIVFIEARA